MTRSLGVEILKDETQLRGQKEAEIIPRSGAI